MHEPSSESPSSESPSALGGRVDEWSRSDPIDRDLDAGCAGERVLRQQFARCMSKVAGTRLGSDPEELHEMRVAIRRMRSALALFRSHLAPAVLDLAGDLKWLGGVLGPVRDLDVQLQQLDGWRSSLSDRDAGTLGSVKDRIRGRWHRERQIMLGELNSQRYTTLVDRIVRTLAGPPIESCSILEAAPLLIVRAHRRVCKLGDRIVPDSPPDRYHRLRVRMKALRYAIEFHRSLYGKPAVRVIQSLKALQDLLGDHQDADVAREQLRGMLTGSDEPGLPAESAFVLGMLDERYRRRAEELRGGFPDAYGTLQGKPWQKLLKAMDRA